jgi:hypothetical protein
MNVTLEMKRLFHIGVLALLLTGNWGSVLAAASCPRAQGHACCHAKSPAHEHEAAPAHDGMTMGGSDGMSAATADVVGADTFEQPSESCAHCMGHSGAPVMAVVLATAPRQTTRDLSATAPEAQEPFARLVSSFASTVISRQHAPPGSAAPRHVLISVFLI